MERSREYALERLDLWYAGRVEKYYTGEVESELLRRIFSYFEGRELFGDEHLSEDEFIEMCPKKNYVGYIVESNFTRSYASAEAFIEEISSEGGVLIRVLMDISYLSLWWFGYMG